MVRGSPIESYGSMDLLLRDSEGEPRRIMQADESVYLHPARAKPGPAAMVVGEDDFPDVVLEVDHTTDVHRGKLALCESWGFPEVWVEVPDTPSPSRPHRRRPWLTIHLLEHGRFRVAAASRAFPGWRAEEIQLAMNEPVMSACTSAALQRVAATLGAREGTGPDDNLLLRAPRRVPLHQSFVFVVRPNPHPHEVRTVINCKRPIIQPCSGRPELADSLEVQRGMPVGSTSRDRSSVARSS